MPDSLSRRTLIERAATLAAAASLPLSEAQARMLDASLKPTSAPIQEPDLLSLVNALQGADSVPAFSKGNTLPLVSRPFAMTNWTPQTRRDDRWFFSPQSHDLIGIRATHQPSPWMGDYGHFTVMALPATADAAATAAYRPEDLYIHPDYISVLLHEHGIRIEMTPTERCAIYRFTFPAGLPGRVVLDAHSGVAIDTAKRMITGRSRLNMGGVTGDFACHFAAVFEPAITRAFATQNGKSDETATRLDGDNIAAVADFDAPTVTLRIGTSFISAEQAMANLHREIGDRTFDAVRAESAAVWNRTLGKIQIAGGTIDQRRTFYSCLYRTQLFPRPLHEFDDAGKPIHYSPYNGTVQPGVLYGDTGFWDTYRTQFPLLSILQPERLGEMIQGFVNAFHEGGWLPQWPSPGLRAVMIGTHIDAAIADAIVKGITGFDREAAYAGLLKDADTPGDEHDRFGRVGQAESAAHGYVPADRYSKATARSLDYYYDDFCISQVAVALGKTSDADRLRQRSLGYHQLYDASTGFFWGKHADGSWQADFDEYAWGGPYVEGGAWQSTWATPHDPAGLMSLMGGRKKFVEKLDRMLLQPPTFKPGTYGGVIHEMAEMAAVDFGQYDQGNQPVHLALYLFAAAGCPEKTQYWTRRVLDKLYTPDQFPGDEDNGEMSAWYVFSALGFYPLCPGHPSYVFGSPLFPEATITVAGGKTLRLRAPATSPANVYVTGITRDGKPHHSLTIGHHAIVSGGSLDFALADRPADRPVADDDLPFSVSPYPAADGDLAGSTIRINCGGENAGAWVGDCFFHGGEVVMRPSAIDTSATHAGPAIVYASERYGAFAYHIPLPMLPGRRSYTVRLHFAEIADNESGGRLQSVRLNGKAVLPHLDLFATAGFEKAVVYEYRGINPDRDGAMIVELAARPDSPDQNAKISGIEVIPTA
jgi:predicted alpha-1,2-mannosidase